MTSPSIDPAADAAHADALREEDVLTNRRNEARRYCCAEHVHWTSDADGERRRGWMHDSSSSGLSFLAPKSERPNRRDELEVRYLGRPYRCRVMRIEPFNWSLSVVACRKLEPTDVQVATSATFDPAGTHALPATPPRAA